MINKNVCPKCGQLYDQNMDRCPLCGAPAPKPDYEPIRRQRITEEERRKHRAEQRQKALAQKKQEREERRRRAAEEEAYLQAEEARERAERRSRRTGIPVEELTDAAPAARRESVTGQTRTAPEPESRKDREEELRPERRSRSKPLFPDWDQEEEPKKKPTPKAKPVPEEKPIPEAAEPEEPEEPEEDETPDRGVPAAYFIISAVALLLALVIGGSYLLWSHGILNVSIYDKITNRPAAAEPVATEPAAPVTEALPSTEATETADLSCAEIRTDVDRIVLTETDPSAKLSYTILPENCPDPVSLAILNENIASVSQDGTVTLKGPGITTLTVRCGEQEAKVEISCVVPLKLNNEDMTFANAGESFALEIETELYEGANVTYATDDPEVAAVDENGTITAVGPGVATIIVSVGDATGEAVVRCNFG